MKNNKWNISTSFESLLKSYLINFSFIALVFLQKESFAQNHQLEILNKGPLFATASLLQDFDNDGDLDIVITRQKKNR